MNIVVLDGDSLGRELDLGALRALGVCTVYGFTSREEVVDRIRNQEVLVTNKVKLDASNLGQVEGVRLICMTGTGTDGIDVEYARSKGIAVCNVAGYATESVAQHTFAMLFYLYENLPYYDNYMKRGGYVDDRSFRHYENTFHQICGKRWGIIGMGAIGRRVAEVATAFGCRVSYFSPSGSDRMEKYPRVDLETLCRESDILSIHAPLNAQTRNLVGPRELGWMSREAVLLNLGRGGIVNEEALVRALREGWIKAAGLDVLEHEPMEAGDPLLDIREPGKLLLTPHIGWASLEARQQVVLEVAKNIGNFYRGTPTHVV
ncbi:D-2-hydroxyacid dehydrogenase [Anaerotalea alkaliphila]|uniref:D-2-hydroxyacid dehydrogenase n=1 Tax=Anaerotalea alkaliphila TaxID=2662126 RepID=A0A7X5KLV7_9FIRM|nr:D-2-hydroxyacid dehydrogenase [Anaerotalea alkaliphila]NDL67114.1 D-2-hydroxyacid dehydrogenase [Anaerotalea alkaliphila]